MSFAISSARAQVTICLDGRVDGASAIKALDSGLIPRRVEPRTLKLVFTASLLDAQYERDCVENK